MYAAGVRRGRAGARIDKDTLPYYLFIAACMLLAILICCFVLRGDRSDFAPEILTTYSQLLTSPGNSDSAATPTSTEAETDFPVYISGAVPQSGVYRMKSGDIIADLLEKAGGFAEDPHSEYVNLAEPLKANSHIYIPYLSEEIEAEENLDNHPSSGNSALDISRCSREELLSVPGIGPVTADAILRMREEGQIKEVADLMKVPGIKEKRYERLARFFQ